MASDDLARVYAETNNRRHAKRIRAKLKPHAAAAFHMWPKTQEIARMNQCLAAIALETAG